MKRTRIVQVLLAVAVVAPGLALGAVHPVTLAALTALAAGLLLALALRGGDDAPLEIDAVGALLLGLAAFTALQLAPLPSGLVSLLSPNAHEIRARAADAVGRPGPALMPLTLDACLTTAELAKLLVYFAVYAGARHLSRQRGPEFVCRLAVAAAGAAAAVFLAHRILLLDRPYGLYEPVHARAGAGRLSAPLLNPNHMAALLGLGAAVAIGQAVSERDRGRRLALVGAAALIGGTVFLTLSRGGMAAFAAGQIVFVVLRVAAGRAGARERGAGLAWLPLGLAVSLGLALFAAQDAVLGEFANTDARKLDIVKESLPLAARFPLAGVGRGAFWVGFSTVSDWTAGVTFTHAENVAVQLIADFGIAVGAIALAGFAAAVGRRLVRPPESAKGAAIVAGLVAFGIHNLVDFSSEIPGVACVAAALLGALTGAEASRRRRRAGAAVPGWAAAGLAAAAVVAAAAVALYVGRYELDREERALRQALGRKDAAAFSPAALGQVLERHPAAWYPPFLGGVHRFAGRRENPLPLLGRALELNPAAAPAHFYVARTLLRAGRVDQALLEFRLAAAYDGSFARPAARILARAAPDFVALSRIARTDADRRRLWPEIASALAAEGEDAEAEKADAALIAMKPPEPRSIARHATRLAARSEFDAARDLAKRLEGPARAELEAEIELKAGSPARAVAALEAAAAARPDDVGLIQSLARARQAAGDHAGAMEAVARLRRLSTGGGPLASALSLEASLKLSEGRVQEALAALRQAHVAAPTDASILRRIADVAEANGDAARALHALEELRTLEPENPAWRGRAERLKRESGLRAERARRERSALENR